MKCEYFWSWRWMNRDLNWSYFSLQKVPSFYMPITKHIQTLLLVRAYVHSKLVTKFSSSADLVYMVVLAGQLEPHIIPRCIVPPNIKSFKTGYQDGTQSHHYTDWKYNEGRPSKVLYSFLNHQQSQKRCNKTNDGKDESSSTLLHAQQ